ncbi:hypothetical protein SNEBB_008107 [Seison nebaliae]|nr:hypothetical protein SNEBB_008107 [Seison nebaliae]
MKVHQIIDGLYLTNLQNAVDVTILRSYDIDAVLSILTHVDYENECRSVFQNIRIVSKHIGVEDSAASDLLSQFDDCFLFIENFLSKRKNVLVHCYMAFSRSPTIIAAYLMKKFDIDRDHAISFIEDRHSIIGPNIGFMIQLKLYNRMGCRATLLNPLYVKYLVSLYHFISNDRVLRTWHQNEWLLNEFEISVYDMDDSAINRVKKMEDMIELWNLWVV